MQKSFVNRKEKIYFDKIMAQLTSNINLINIIHFSTKTTNVNLYEKQNKHNS